MKEYDQTRDEGHVRAGHKALLAVLPASHHINLERLGAVVDGKVHMLDERKCAELFPDCEARAVPPFGELYGLPVYGPGTR